MLRLVVPVPDGFMDPMKVSCSPGEDVYRCRRYKTFFRRHRRSGNLCWKAFSVLLMILHIYQTRGQGPVL